jgi:hypothetical protein
MKNYLDLVVVISPGPDGDYAVRVTSDEFGQKNAKVKLPFTLDDLSRALLAMGRQIGTIVPKGNRSGAAEDLKSAEDLGVDLFNALFQGEVRDLLVLAQGKAQTSAETGVRIRLSMDLQAPGMAKIASLPWELMCRGRGEAPMALSTQTTLVRALDVVGRTDPAPFVAPLRIMVVMSNPEGTTKLDLDKERKQIEATWGALLNVKVDFVPPVAAEIRRRLRATNYHVIHYMGHGDFDDDAGGGILLLEKEDHSADPFTGDEFAGWLVDAPLRLVFLNACKTGTTGERSGAHPFAGVAAALIKQKVPAVVAMQFPISDSAAILFARTFYECILQGAPVDAAIVEGRKDLRANKETASEWATPVLYLRSKDGVLFEWGQDRAPEARAAPGTVAPEDPWGADAGDAFRVFLTTPDMNLMRRRTQLAQALKSLEGVRVVDSVPTTDITAHAAAVDRLVRRADLCVHLLGANPGMRLDDDDGRPLRTYPLVELDIGRQAAKSQLVLITNEDKESIGVKDYAAFVEELAKLRRDKNRFELVITDKNRIMDSVKTKLEELRRARQDPTPSSADGKLRKAFVDSHVTDADPAGDLAAYLIGRDVDTEIQTSSRPTTDFTQLDETVRKSSLYIIVAGRVDKGWVTSRKVAILKSAIRTKAALLIARYCAIPAEGSDSIEITRSRFEDVSALNDTDPRWIDSLFA